MDVSEFMDDLRAGRYAPERVVVVIESFRKQLSETRRRLEEAQSRIAELEKKLGPQATTKVDEPYSLRAEEKRQKARGKKVGKKNKPSRRGRVTTAEKVKRADRHEKCFPEGVPEGDCSLSHTRPVWRMENCQAVLVAYDIYRAPNGQYGKTVTSISISKVSESQPPPQT